MQGAVELVRAGLDGVTDDATAGVAQFRVVRIRDDLELLHGVHLGNGRRLVVIRAGIGGAVDQDFIGSVTASIDPEIIGLILADGIVTRNQSAAGCGRTDGARSDGDQEQRVPCKQRNAGDELVLDDCSAIGAVSGDERRLIADDDRLFHIARRERDVERLGLSDLQRHRFDVTGGESGDPGVDVVGARRN